MNLFHWAVLGALLLVAAAFSSFVLALLAVTGRAERRAERMHEEGKWDRAFERELACPDCGHAHCDRCPRWAEDPRD